MQRALFIAYCLPEGTPRCAPCHSNCPLLPGAQSNRRALAHRCAGRLQSARGWQLPLRRNFCTSAERPLCSIDGQTKIYLCQPLEMPLRNNFLCTANRTYLQECDSYSSKTPVDAAGSIFSILFETPHVRFQSPIELTISERKWYYYY